MTEQPTGTIVCHCGGMEGTHFVGEGSCYREVVPAPVLLEEASNDWAERWLVEGSEVTGYTLKQQRLYHHHRDGIWSRPKGGGSINSLPDET